MVSVYGPKTAYDEIFIKKTSCHLHVKQNFLNTDVIVGFYGGGKYKITCDQQKFPNIVIVFQLCRDNGYIAIGVFLQIGCAVVHENYMKITI